jgi:adenylate cyclase
MVNTTYSALKAPGSRRKKLNRRLIFIIALAWTTVDFLFFLWRKTSGLLSEKYYQPDINFSKELLLRELNVFVISLFIGWILVKVLKNYLRDSSLGVNLLVKTLILIGAALIMNFFIYVTYEWLINGHTLRNAIEKLGDNIFQNNWLLKKMPEWGVFFIFTMLGIEINEKYSPGVFLDIMLGKYLQPKEERRIIVFLDLRDSTPIAEKLGNKEYFKFIRDFISYISAGFIENDARIYQYVGDEVVVWWPESKENARKAISALLTARKILNKETDRFKQRYGTIPEYKTGLHTGLVTVGQVGIVKKDLVMSGDAMNTTARIRDACTETHHKYIASKDLIDLLDMEEWQAEPMGPTDLKGKNQDIELFALKI